MQEYLKKNDFAKFKDTNKEQFAAEDKVIETLATRYELKQLHDKIFLTLE